MSSGKPAVFDTRDGAAVMLRSFFPFFLVVVVVARLALGCKDWRRLDQPSVGRRPSKAPTHGLDRGTKTRIQWFRVATRYQTLVGFLLQ